MPNLQEEIYDLIERALFLPMAITIFNLNGENNGHYTGKKPKPFFHVTVSLHHAHADWLLHADTAPPFCRHTIRQ